MRKINFSSCAVMDNKIWFVTNDNDFICMDIFSGEAHYVMPRGNKVFNGVINTMVKYKRKIYWVEQNGERLLSYDVDTMFCKTYMLNGINAYGGIAFCSINIIGNKLVLLPKYNDEIIIFDLEEETFSERKNIFSKYISFSKNGYVDYVVLMNECVYIFLNDGFTIIKYDLEEDEISTILQESKRAHVYSSCLYKNSIIDLDCEGNIWFSKNDFQIRKKLLLDKDNFIGFYKIFCFNEKLIILPSRANNILMLDIDSGKLEIMETPEDLSFDNPTWTKYLEVMEQDDMIIIPNRTANYVTVMDKETSNIRWIKPKKIKCDEGLEYIRWHNHSLEIEDDLELLMCYLKKMI